MYSTAPADCASEELEQYLQKLTILSQNSNFPVTVNPDIYLEVETDAPDHVIAATLGQPFVFFSITLSKSEHRAYTWKRVYTKGDVTLVIFGWEEILSVKKQVGVYLFIEDTVKVVI